MNEIIKNIEAEQLKENAGDFRVGDTVRVHAKIREGNRERIQVFEGTVLKIQGGGIRATFTVRKNSNGIGVEKTWPLHSPHVEKVEVVRRGKVRRAKLNYLRQRVGKSAKVKELLSQKPSVVVAVSEGIRTEDGTYVCELGNSVDFVDAFGHKQLSGTASYLANFIAGEIGCKTRAIELSTLQRSASHAASRVDILEAYQVGGAAVKAADEGDSGKMVVLQRLSDDPYQCGTEVKDVHKIANDEKLVPREWVNAEGTGVTDEFVAYVRPLIQGDVSPVMVDGIPRHLFRPYNL